MGEILDDFARHWPLNVSIPIVAALIGYTTKLVAIRMMFQPLDFVGIKPFFGWQGIVPRRAARMAGIAVDTMTQQLIKPAEIMARLPETMRYIEDYAEDAMDIRNTLVNKMKALEPEEFEGLLRPAFQQDEWILITTGAILGFCVGEAQVLLLEHFAS